MAKLIPVNISNFYIQGNEWEIGMHDGIVVVNDSTRSAAIRISYDQMLELVDTMYQFLEENKCNAEKDKH